MNDFLTTAQTAGTDLNAVFLYAMMAWELVWKGFALWRAAQRKEVYWFTAMLVINTIGLLPILYLFIFSDRKERKARKHAAHHAHNHEEGGEPKDASGTEPSSESEEGPTEEPKG
jgi:predicted membrane channel-forming protein YqfA (hemolysin III family)